MPANIEFTEFTDPIILFASPEAANQFFAGIQVPDASAESPGVMLQAPNVPIIVPVVTPYVQVTVLNADGSQTVETVVTQAAFDQLQASVNAILANLKAAGIMVAGA